MFTGLNAARITLVACINAVEFNLKANNTPVYEFTLAGNDRVITATGEVKDLPFYHRGSAVGQPAEYYNGLGLVAGDAVLVEGTLEYSIWTNEEGQKRSGLKIKPERILPLKYALDEDQAIIDAAGNFRMQGATNQVEIIGHVTKDVVVNTTKGGEAVTTFGVAINETWNDKQGARQEKVHFIDVEAYRELATEGGFLKRGDPVRVTGRLTNESFTDKDGNKRNATRVEAQSVTALMKTSKPAEAAELVEVAAEVSAVVAAPVAAKTPSKRARKEVVAS